MGHDSLIEEARQAALEVIKRKPHLKGQIKDLFSLMTTEIDDEGSVSHEVELFMSDLKELDEK